MNTNENEDNRLSWSALEYEEKERSRDWFWALGIIVVTSSVASIIFGNYFFAVLLILSGILLGFFAIKRPDTIVYELNNKGLKIGTRLYLYEDIKSFYVQIGNKPLLFIKSERAFMPILVIPIEEEMIESVHSIMIEKNVEEEEMKEPSSERIMDALGF